MATLSLNDDQLRVVAELVEARLGEIHSEVRRSQTYTWRDELKHEMETLKALQVKLAEVQPAGPGGLPAE
jgi:hypothetical protein